MRFNLRCAVLVITGWMSFLSAGVTITEYPVGPGSLPYEITTGPDGRLWFTQQVSMNSPIGAITTTGAVSEYSTPDGANNGITAAKNALWFCNGTPGYLGSMTTSGVLSTPSKAYSFVGITVGPDGYLWISTAVPSQNIVSMDFAGNIQNTYKINDIVPSIVTGPDKNLWFVAQTNSAVVQMTTGGQMTSFTLPPGSNPNSITLGPDGNLWFTEPGTNKIGKITIGGSITEYNIPTPKSSPEGIVTGPDGNLWFTENGANQIGQITTSGMITEYPIPTKNSGPHGITLGPDGNLWFTELTSGQIGKIVISASPSPSGSGTFTGKRHTNDFGIVEEYYNNLYWEDVTTTDLIGYALYRNGELIAELPSDQNSYQDHNRKKSGVDSYTLYPVNGQGLGAGITTTVGGHS